MLIVSGFHTKQVLPQLELPREVGSIQNLNKENVMRKEKFLNHGGETFQMFQDGEMS
jgi:hypothetical protein